MCECTEYTGPTCEEDVNECEDVNFCQYGGTCMVRSQGYVSIISMVRYTIATV